MFFVQDIAGNLTSPLWSSDPHIVEKLIAYHPYAFDFLHLSSHVAHLVSRLWIKVGPKLACQPPPEAKKNLGFPTYYDFKAAISLGNTS